MALYGKVEYWDQRYRDTEGYATSATRVVGNLGLVWFLTKILFSWSLSQTGIL